MYCTAAHLTHLPPSTEQALQKQAHDIWDAYYLGNKSTARAMFSQVKHTRKAYVATWIMLIAENVDAKAKAYRFICDITL